MEDASPCQACDECKGVSVGCRLEFMLSWMRSSLGDEQHIRDLIGKKDGLKWTDWRIFVVDNAGGS